MTVTTPKNNDFDIRTNNGDVLILREDNEYADRWSFYPSEEGAGHDHDGFVVGTINVRPSQDFPVIVSCGSVASACVAIEV